MKTVIIGFALATIANTAVLSAPSFGATPQTDPSAELQSIIETQLMPAAKNANDAVALSAADPAKACQLAQSASTSLLEAQKRVMALEAKLKAEGRDASPLAPVKAKLTVGVPQFQDLARSVCNGEIAQVQTDPSTKAMATEIGGDMKTYSDDVFAALEADKRGDRAGYCQHYRHGRATLDRLSDYLVNLRKTTTFAPEELAALDGLNEKITTFRAQTNQALQTCPTLQ